MDQDQVGVALLGALDRDPSPAGDGADIDVVHPLKDVLHLVQEQGVVEAGGRRDSKQLFLTFCGLVVCSRRRGAEEGQDQGQARYSQISSLHNDQDGEWKWLL